MEYCDNGDLYQKIVKHQKKRKLFKESEIWQILIQVILFTKNIFTKKDGQGVESTSRYESFS
jgi:hypothetical protein